MNVLAAAWQRGWWSCSLLIALLVLPPQARAEVDFETQLRPLLSDRCYVCHGPDESQRQAGLRLDLREGVIGKQAEGSGRAVVVAGDADASELFRRLIASDASERMPPEDSNLSLSADEIELVRRWINEGAAWSEHWAFRPPQPVSVPETYIDAWKQNPIDCFLSQRIHAAGLMPNPPADPETLVRRVTLDITGLPPSAEQIAALVADSSPAAYERYVDSLLASDAYAERMATEWLDVARYSDTFGYQVDRDRFVWPYRDWVIRAFQRNMPYDQFIVQQLAGDLLPGATDEQVLATTFNRLHPQKVEGGSVPEEFRVEYVADRAHTVGTAFLGLTFECARCHDHKYDPITQRDYYSLAAFFDNIDEAGLYSYFTDAVPTPTLLLHDEHSRAELKAAEQAVAAAEARLAELRTTSQERFVEWRKSHAQLPEPPVARETQPAEEAEDLGRLLSGRLARISFDEPVSGGNRSVEGRWGNGIEFSGDDPFPTSVGNFHRYEPFSLSVWLWTPTEMERAVVLHRSRAWTDAGSRGYELLLEEGRLSAALIHFWPGNALRVVSAEPLPLNAWTHVVMTYDGSSRAAGLRLFVNGRPVAAQVVRDNLYKDITGGGGDTITLGERFRDRGFRGGRADELQVFGRELTSLECAQLYDGQSLLRAVAGASDARDVIQDDPLYLYYLANFDHDYRVALDELRLQRQRGGDIVEKVAEIMVMREMPQRRISRVLLRGAYDAPGDIVEPNTPGFLPELPDSLPRDRLGLAEWLIDPQHPLTARVTVNRYWQMIFGHGLIRTPEDFGSQGQPPTHPELLDWLALDFQQHGWDVKRLIKQLVLSEAYRQSSVVSMEKRQRDPENLLLARGPVYRLSAEMIRDSALAVSGLLVRRVGGPPVRPYEMTEAFEPRDPDPGDGVYRRSVYTYWKRNAPAPVMLALDAAKRDVCRVRRERTSSPLQSLVMLNAPQYVEAARALAAHAMTRSDDADTQLRTVFAEMVGRSPDDQQLAALRRTRGLQVAWFADHPEARDAYLQIGRFRPAASIDLNELAGLTAVANALFDFDPVINKR